MTLAPTISMKPTVTASPRSKAVILYYHGTFIHMRNGAHSRFDSLLRFLLARGYAVTLYSFEDHYDEPWDEAAISALRRRYPSVRLVLDRRTKALDRLTALKHGTIALFPSKVQEILKHRARGRTPNYDALLAESPDTPWIVNYPDAFTELNGLPTAPIFVETHDIRFISKSKRARRSLISAQALLQMRSEFAVLDRADGIVAISPVEAGFYRTMLSKPDIFYIASYGAAASEPNAEQTSKEYAYDLLFVGSEMWQNQRGLLDFFERHGDWAKNYRIAIAGKVGDDPAVRALALRFASVSVLGFVADLAQLYASSKAALSPVDGTGLKIKAVEALSYGLPVFGSRHTLEGLPPGNEGCAFPIEPDVMSSVLDSPARLDEARRGALSYWSRMPELGEAEAFERRLSAAAVAVTPR